VRWAALFQPKQGASEKIVSPTHVDRLVRERLFLTAKMTANFVDVGVRRRTLAEA
jgi:hypothetical protein